MGETEEKRTEQFDLSSLVDLLRMGVLSPGTDTVDHQDHLDVSLDCFLLFRLIYAFQSCPTARFGQNNLIL
jgi:hypothetical protein